LATKRGRKRKPGPRTKSGRLSRSAAAMRDDGTAEGRAKRQAIVNGHRDQALASIPLDICFARGWLTEQQRGAGLRFRALRAKMFGVPLKVGSGAPMPSEEVVAKNERAYLKLVQKLTTQQQLAVVGMALDQQPGWMRLMLRDLPLRHEHEIERRALLSGLDALG
jgi:hypothetical protein